MSYALGCLIAACVGWVWDRRPNNWRDYVLPMAGFVVGGSPGAAAAGYVARRRRGA